MINIAREWFLHQLDVWKKAIRKIKPRGVQMHSSNYYI